MTGRTTPSGLAPLVELLELEQPRVITAPQLTALAREAGITWPTYLVAQRLRERGWLLTLAAKGVWEFAPAARAGAFGSGDPLIELRAVLARSPSAPYAVAAESAAYLLGLTSRRPEPEVVGAPGTVRLPKSLSALRIVRWGPAVSLLLRDDLPTWAPATLVAFMATRPSGYHDWPNVGEWLRQAVNQVDFGDLALELLGRSRGSWARAAYLLGEGGSSDVASALLAQAPAGSGPYYLGHRSTPGRYSRRYDVIDSTGMEVMRV